MCTAVSYKNYFGRNLDLERGYGESVVITPRGYNFPFRFVEKLEKRYALIGMATVVNNIPLYYEASNEVGLSIAGLNFPNNAYYHEMNDKENVAPFELIPWVLGQCASVFEVKKLLSNMNLVNAHFSDQLPLSPLHWMISDPNESIVVECMKDGLHVHDNPFHILTNNPPFEFHKLNINQYMGLNVGPATNQLTELPLDNFSLGMGALGLPGDFSSPSRFIKAFFVKEKSVFSDDERLNVNQFFHILQSVSMPKGCVWTKNGFEYTRYSSCCNVEKGIYSYMTYDNFEIISVNMHDVDLNSSNLYTYEVKDL